MVNITIDNHTIAVPSGTTIMEAAASIHIPIPKLCYLKDINEIGACRVCVVEIEGQDHLYRMFSVSAYFRTVGIDRHSFFYHVITGCYQMIVYSNHK